jgi:aryl-alcohol dehydrogenase-like predicted oxidoreductase
MNLLGDDIAPLGMGCWAIGGAFYAGEQSLGFADVHDAESTRTIHAALDAGVRLFDTAAVYGAGHAERLLGAALKNRPDALIVSKLGTAFDEQSKQVLGDQTAAAEVDAAIDASLRRLQRDCVDVMLLHLNSLPVEVALPIFEVLEKARAGGKIRAFGWSTDFPASAAAMASMDGFIGVEHAMSVFMDVPTIQSIIDQHDLIGFIRSPLAMGILTGKFNQVSTLPVDDVRAMNSDRRDYFHDARVAPKYLDNLEVIRELLQTGGRSLAQGALCWLLAKSGRNIPLPGARTVAQVRENAGAIEFGALPVAVMHEIETLIERGPEGEPRAR